MLFLQSNGDKSQPELHESVSPCVASPESQYSFSRVLGDVAGKKHNVVNDGANPATPDLALGIRFVAERFLSDHSQQIISNDG